MTVPMPQIGPVVTSDDRRNATADVAHVRGTLAEVVVVDGAEAVGVATRDAEDRLGSRRPGSDPLERWTDDPGIAGEQCLGHEDRADLLAGTERGLLRQRRELGGCRFERRR